MRNAVGGVQSALVLGGGSDIAQATAFRLVERGCRTVILAARRPDDLDAVAARLKEAGASTVETVPFDAADTDTHPAMIDELFARHGDIDLVLVAFGVLGDQDEFDDDIAAAVAAVEVNYVGGVSTGLATVKRMKEQGHGVLVYLSSVAGERVRQSNLVYGSSKAGLDGFAQGLGDRVVGDGVDVMVVRPGFVISKMTEGLDPVPFSTTPDEVAASIVGGLEKRSHTVWSPPILRWVMLALRHVPRAVFRRLPV
jgi:decaprenylphospho-beta-D-erythro-pentofuranosid-2-ulose 2-reductase